MQITNIRVSYLRERQPAQYEKQTPAIELAAVLDEGDDYSACARTLMLEAATIAYNAMGFDVPAKIPQKLANGEVPEGGEVIVGGTLPTEEASEAAEKPAEKPKRKSGRPAGSKNTRPKAGTKAAKKVEEEQKAAIAAAEAEKAKDDDADSIPDDDDKGMPQVSTNPENRVDPDADSIPDDDAGVAEAPLTVSSDADDIPDDDAETVGVEDTGDPTDAIEQAESKSAETVDFTAADLNTMIGTLLQSDKLSLPDAKSITRHFQVARVHDLNPEQVLEARSMIEKMLEARK